MGFERSEENKNDLNSTASGRALLSVSGYDDNYVVGGQKRKGKKDVNMSQWIQDITSSHDMTYDEFYNQYAGGRTGDDYYEWMKDQHTNRALYRLTDRKSVV